jgi:hypothetical protein
MVRHLECTRLQLKGFKGFKGFRGRVDRVSLLEIQRMRSRGWDSEEMVQTPLGNCSVNTHSALVFEWSIMEAIIRGVERPPDDMQVICALEQVLSELRLRFEHPDEHCFKRL